MQVAPIAMVADADIARLGNVVDIFLHGHGERLRSLRGGDDAAVAVGLLNEMVVLLNDAQRVAVKLLVPLHRTEISG